MAHRKQRRVLVFISSVVLLQVGSLSLRAETLPKDCSSYIGPGRTVTGHTVGPETCRIVEERGISNAQGIPFRRIEIGISGTIAGYTLNDDSLYSPYFTDVPEFALAQRGVFGPYVHGIIRYQADKGSGMTVFLPESPANWNGKLFVTAHGSSLYSPVGELLPREPHRYNLFMGTNAYVGLMIDKGYAVAYTRRSAAKLRSGGEQVTMDGGTVLEGKEFGYHTGLLRSFTQLAENLIEARLGRKPSRTYWYGKSGGGALGRLINYAPGANLDANGEKVIDGMLIDDAGGGWYMPTLYFQRTEVRDGEFSVKADSRDHLIFDDIHQEAFAHQIDIAHQIYTGNDFVTGEYITVKRENARYLVEKGLGSRSRTYEIVGVSHADAGYVWKRDPELAKQNLDLSGVFEALIDGLDRWVDQDVAPGPTRSDDYSLGDADGDGQIENPAIALPEIACPTGVYYEFPDGITSPGRTGFAPYLRQRRPAVNADTESLPLGFEEAWLEPLDSRGYLVDMNQNHVRDTRDSIAEAWQRRAREGKKTGILGPQEVLTHARYVSCVARAASELLEQNLLSESAVLDYIKKATDSDVGNASERSIRSQNQSQLLDNQGGQDVCDSR